MVDAGGAKTNNESLRNQRMDQITLVKVTLQEAHELDLLARELRRKAGTLLAELREERPRDWASACDLDARTGQLLITMAVGVEVRS